MNSRYSLFTILLAGILLPASRLAAQGDSLKPLRNIVEVFNSQNNALNGIYPNLKPSNYGSPGLKGGWGASYIRLIGKQKIGMELGFHEWIWGGDVIGWPQNANPAGFVVQYYSSYLLTRCHYPLVSTGKFNWYVSGGGTFRSGGEVLVVRNTPGFDGIMIGQKHRDLGLSLGTRFSWYPHRRIVLSGDVRYTRFVYRYTTSSIYVPSYQGTTKNLLSAQVRLGFCF